MVSQSEIEILIKFIPALVQKHHELKIENFNFEHYHLHKLFTGLNDIEKKRQIYIKENAPYFNIFDILRYGHYETRLHTPLLVHLLTPDGDHQIDTKFFSLFIDLIFGKPFEITGLSNIEVYEEYQSARLEGQIDIFIKFLYNKDLYFAAIENKINASDQKDQLSRYYDYLSLQTSDKRNIKLIYLTKNGSKPSMPYSIGEEKFNLLLNDGILILLSYKREISEITSKILNGKNPHSVNEILKQYLKTIISF